MENANSNSAFIIASQYELIRRIISTLSESDLQSCEKVSTLWADAVRAERSSLFRLKPQALYWQGLPERKNVIFYTMFLLSLLKIYALHKPHSLK